MGVKIIPKFKFVDAVHSTLPKLRYGWLLEVNDLNTLLVWRDNIFIHKLSRCFRHAFECLQKNQHPNPNNHVAAHLMFKTQHFGKSLIDNCVDLESKIFNGQIECLKSGPIFIQRIGSYMTKHCITIESEILKNDLHWPEKKILSKNDVKINKWPGGNHYYLEIDEIPLGKFNTVEYAENEAERYIKFAVAMLWDMSDPGGAQHRLPRHVAQNVVLLRPEVR